MLYDQAKVYTCDLNNACMTKVAYILSFVSWY